MIIEQIREPLKTNTKTEKMIYNREHEADVLEKIFNMFTEKLEKKGVITQSGSIVDATFVEAPRQRNTKEENKEKKRVEYRRSGKPRKTGIK